MEQQDAAKAQQQAQQGMEQVKPIASTLRGTIGKIDLDKGELKVKPAEGDEITLKARPYDLEKLEENQQASLRVLDFQGEKWLAPEKGATAQALEKRGWAQQIAVGSIENVDRKTGEVKIEGESYKVHPQEAVNLQPGQFVSLSFSEFGDNQWVAGVKTGAAAQKEASQEAKRSSQMNDEKGAAEKGSMEPEIQQQTP